MAEDDVAHSVTKFRLELDPSGRAVCKEPKCKTPIVKGTLRVSKEFTGKDGERGFEMMVLCAQTGWCVLVCPDRLPFLLRSPYEA
jgi:hypothetical protein